MKRGPVLLLLTVALLTAASAVLAQSPGEPAALPQATYDLSWWTVDGGGQTASAGARYTLGGTAGQPDAAVLNGEDYTLIGGFWAMGTVPMEQKKVYLPLVLRGH